MGLRVWILDLLFPPRCVFCRGFLQQKDASYCPACADDLPFCPDERREHLGDFYSVCVAPLFYQDHVRESIQRFKFHNAQGYRRTYGPLLAECIETHLSDEYDFITWAPVSKKRRRKRGYDQGELLAVETASYLDKPCVSTLQKTKDTAPLSSLGGRVQRRAAIADAYIVPQGSQVSGKRILLIDDVFTTGATMSECARCLLLAGAKEVLCATLARTPLREVESLESEIESVVETV